MTKVVQSKEKGIYFGWKDVNGLNIFTGDKVKVLLNISRLLMPDVSDCYTLTGTVTYLGSQARFCVVNEANSKTLDFGTEITSEENIIKLVE